MKIEVAFLTLFLCITIQVSGQMFQQSQVEAGIEHTFAQSTFNGGGAAWIDIDNDDDDDLYLTGGNEMDQLYINNGEGTFSDISGMAGIDSTATFYTTGVIVGDVNNDGFKDIFVNTYYSDSEALCKNLLYINNGDNTFTESWEMDRVEDKTMAMGSVFIDFNLDGFLDIYTVSYVENPIFTFDENNDIDGFAHDCFTNRMYQNNGDLTFTDVTMSLNLGDAGCALAVTASDFDMDHDMDILLGNDFGPFLTPNKLFEYRRALNQYVDRSSDTGADNAMFSMGIAVGDYDNDLDFDYYISNLGANVLLENQGASFIDVADAAQCTNTHVYGDTTLSVSWGNLFADIDNDGDEDLFVSNGYVPGPSNLVNNGLLDPDRLFINNGDKTFTMLDTTVGINNLLPARGATYSDYDKDGDLDILSVVYDKPSFGFEPSTILFENISEVENNWVGIKLEGTTVNRDAYGSKVYVYTPNTTQIRELSGGASFCSHHTSILHFGLGDESQIDSVKVIWTGGITHQLESDIVLNQINKIVEVFNPLSTIDINTINVNSWPNPTKGYVNIEWNDKLGIDDLKVYNTLGQNLDLAWTVSNGKIEIQLEGAEGLYYIRIVDSKGGKYSSSIAKIK